MPIPFLSPKKHSHIGIPSNWRHTSRMRPRRKEKRELLHRILRIAVPVIVIGLLIGGIGLVGMFAWFSRDLPNPDRVIDRSLAQSTKIYARDGTTLLYEVHGEEKRTVINLEDIPEYAKWATISIEDRNFYTHKGFSLTGIVKAMCHEVVGNLGGLCPQRGGSTITQQFVKNAILTDERSITRKMRELILAYQIERKYSKDQILKLYFNEIPYGSSAYGIEAASQTYFNTSAKDLTVAEAALLAALPQAPSYYYNNQEEWFGRQKYVLKLLLDEGHITKEQYDNALNEKITILAHRDSITAPHFVFYVREYLASRYGEKVVEQGGLRVTTTLDPEKQRIAEEAVKNGAERNVKYKASNAAMVALDTKTGQILAMVGSKNFFDESIDGNVNVTTRPRQPGSSFKPIVYATAFKKGYTPDTLLFDLNMKFKTDTKDYEPKNYDLKEHGPLTMRQALAGSLNIPAVQTLYLVGVESALDTAHDLGYTTLTDPSRYGLALVLGGGEVKLLEHTSAFATFAREGLRHPTTPILKIEDKDGKLLDEFHENEIRALDQQVSQQINDILTDNNARSFIFGSRNYLTLPDRPVAAKTGTTNDYRDAWTVGYTPSIAAGVWVGNNDNSEMSRGADGSVVAAPIWNEFMKKVLTGTPVEIFHKPKPENVTKPILKGEIESDEIIKVDKVTGKRIPSTCLDTYPADFITEKTYKNVHSILYYVDKNNPRGPVPEHPEKDPQFTNFEEPVARWAKEHGYITALPSDESCTLRAPENQPQVTLISPTVGTTVATPSLTVAISFEGKATFKRVEYLIDGVKVGESTSLTDEIALGDLSPGFHTLTVTVSDTVENQGTASSDFNYLPAPEPIDGGSAPVL